MRVWSKETCKKAYEEYSTLDGSMFCAGGETGKDACEGDSGGPVVAQRDGKDTLVGGDQLGKTRRTGSARRVRKWFACVEFLVFEHA